MKFIRNSLTAKAIFLFTTLVVILSVIGVILLRKEIVTIPLHLFIAGFFVLLVLILVIFLIDVVKPLNQLTKQVKGLLTGNQYQRIEPTTIDEIGVFTHFFNEITRDLEKISYDVKERRRMSSELDIAAQIQKNVLPKEAPNLQGLDIVAKTKSAAEVGGDSFDFLTSPDNNQNFIYIGDVTGHGVPAGLIMVMVDTLIHSLVAAGVNNSKDILVNTNTLLTPRIGANLFMTLVMLRWDVNLQKMFYTGAGHEHILIYKAKTEEVQSSRAGGIALGMIPNNSKVIHEKEIPIEVGDVIVLYTDGLTEAKNTTGEMYGIERMSESLKKHGYMPSAESIFDHITKDFSNFVNEYVQIDDTTMIVMKYVGKDAGTKTKLTITADQSVEPDKNWSWNG